MRTQLVRSICTALLTMAPVAIAAPSDAPLAMPEAPKTTTTTTTTTEMKPSRGGSEDAVLSTKEGWNSDWALLFAVNNFIGGNAGFLSAPVTGSIAGEYFLSDVTAIRAGVTLTRQMAVPQITKNVTTTGGTSVTTYTFNQPGFTEFDAATLRAEYLMRLTKSALSPYLGAGAQFTGSYTRNNYVDEVTNVGQRTELDNHTWALDFTVRGTIGAEWRFNPNFALYADYNVNLSLFNSQMINFRTTVEDTVGGVTSTTQTTNQRTVNTFLQLNTGLSQGASLGLEIFF